MSKFDPATDIPDLTGKVILVTGGSSGLGEATISHYAPHNPLKIYLATRSKPKADAAIARLLAAHPSANIEFLPLDLSSFTSIKAAAASFNAASPRLDILQLNGGAGAPPKGVSADGYEIVFATNYLGHAALTQSVMPKLLETAKLPGADVRVITMSSVGHKSAKGIAFDELRTPMRGSSGLALYSQSMLARTHYAFKLAGAYPQLTSVSLHPGTVRSSIADTSRETSSWFSLLLFRIVFAVAGVETDEGAKNQVYLSVAKGLKSGGYYEPVGKENPAPISYRQDMADRLWGWTADELKRNGFPGWP